MRGTSRSGKLLGASCTVQVSTCACEAFCCCPVASPQIRECGVSLKKRKLDEDESRMLKADLMVKRIGDELKAKKSTFIELCNERSELLENISVEEELLGARCEEMNRKYAKKYVQLEQLVCKKKQAEDDYKQRGKRVEYIDSKIVALKTELNKVEETKLELVHEQDLCETWIREVNSERIKLKKSIEKLQLEDKEEVEKKQVTIENMKTRISEVITEIENLPNDSLILPHAAHTSDSPYKALREFIEKEIVSKEKELECPVCLEIASPPILTCPEQHLICRLCRAKTEHCPVCSRSYQGEKKRHRYAEQAVEEVTRLKSELEQLK